VSIGSAILCFIVAQRFAELALAARNTRQLRRLGAVEIDTGGYPWFIALHASWLASLALILPGARVWSWALLGLFAALQLGRLWVIGTLGRRWTTRIIVLPGEMLVARGPYRYVRHPNYLVVAAEIAALPLAFGAVALAGIFSAANLALIARRIAIEDRALATAQPALDPR
jgi:methyltransferase